MGFAIDTTTWMQHLKDVADSHLPTANVPRKYVCADKNYSPCIATRAEMKRDGLTKLTLDQIFNITHGSLHAYALDPEVNSEEFAEAKEVFITRFSQLISERKTKRNAWYKVAGRIAAYILSTFVCVFGIGFFFIKWLYTSGKQFDQNIKELRAKTLKLHETSQKELAASLRDPKAEELLLKQISEWIPNISVRTNDAAIQKNLQEAIARAPKELDERARFKISDRNRTFDKIEEALQSPNDKEWDKPLQRLISCQHLYVSLFELRCKILAAGVEGIWEREGKKFQLYPAFSNDYIPLIEIEIQRKGQSISSVDVSVDGQLDLVQKVAGPTDYFPQYVHFVKEIAKGSLNCRITLEKGQLVVHELLSTLTPC